MLAVCVPGHALELDAITQRESLLAVRRQVNRDHTLRHQASELRYRVQTLHGGGPVGRLFQVLDQLRWTWPSFRTVLDDWGTPIPWLSLPQGAFMHLVRASQKRAFLWKIPATRHDLGHLRQVPQGLDMFATTWKARAQGAAKCTPWQLGLLHNYLAGGDHTQQRKSEGQSLR